MLASRFSSVAAWMEQILGGYRCRGWSPHLYSWFIPLHYNFYSGYVLSRLLSLCHPGHHQSQE